MTFKYDGSDKFEQNNTSRSLVRLIKSSTFGLGLTKINATQCLSQLPFPYSFLSSASLDNFDG